MCYNHFNDKVNEGAVNLHRTANRITNKKGERA